jgi:hypothetical protein
MIPTCGRKTGSNHRTTSSLVAMGSLLRIRAVLWGYGCICQTAAGAPGVPLLVNVAPFMSQM